MNASVAKHMRVSVAPDGWYFSTKLRIGLNFFNRLLTNSIVLLLADLTGLLLSFECASLARYFIMGEMMNPNWIFLLGGIWSLGAIAWGLLPGWGLSPVESLRRQVILTVASFGAIAALMFLSKSADNYSRFTVLLAFMLAIPLIPFVRMTARRMLIRYSLWGTPVAIYGGGNAGRYIIERLKAEPGHGYYPVCVFDDDETLQDKTVEGVPVRGTTQSVVQNVPIAILAITKIEGERIDELMQGPLSSYLRVMLIPNLVHTPSLWVTSRDLCGVPGLEMKNNLLDPTLRFIKRSFEVAVTWLTLPLWGPLFCLLYCAIWLDDRENPIYKQRRIGQFGMPFQTWKFRTMVMDADRVLEEHLRADPALREEWREHCKLRKDPRITRVGRFLRKTSLDEIPQLINVLKGDMSLIGPRPLPEYHYIQLPKSVQKLRERVKPGMTGLWQVSGRSDAGNEGMVRWDPYYVRNWSLWLDIVILVRTVRVVLLGSGAH
ncbi:undecaprenyl-phosphate galactose phosphotransferase WbaP [Coraliomargarita akajimensis]|uniref:Undecaprenyl-phosphate galactose phosphotransferase, WbaP n=1 Tax=Coraliomargarita akajimensis (strain DSM 45221 / IAM 15411 / JCM 23193 / KCTC 12865 / 04OKA010-24) TaxID=583355 RepID=D5EMM8_CORAD|nr:undecaprenyl-phosphate galactose phosphotransferase WbaP [Coraliomargarita akajimensis]ADE53434.1 Undecaprenyl-phosphate galactose phosphotransferase, WbaP [Coraliomargarita akajimensis DSM 45221]